MLMGMTLLLVELVSEPDPHTQRRRRVWIHTNLKSAEFWGNESDRLMTV